MKNLKKVLALALAFAMSLTLFAGAAFTDAADIGVDYADDVEMLVQLGVVNGYEDGSFKPQGNITRAEFAKMAYTLKYGYDDQGKLFAGQKSQFSDVEGNGNISWAKGYINYCANQGIVGGVGGGKFNPNGNVTVAEAAKMLLVILGADATKEGYGGSNWTGNVTADAMEFGVFAGWYGDPTQPATRELVCKLMRNTVFAPTYQYNPITGIGSQVSALDPNVKNETLGEKTMGLKHVEGIVVSNERYAIDKDPEGKRLEKTATVQPMDKAQIYYEIENSANTALNGTYALLTIDTDLSDDMLGTMVNVYFKADGNVGNYANVKIIGDVLTSSKTVAYDVAAADIAIMPDGESSSTSNIKPYISFTTADGEEKIVNTRTEYDADGKAIENTVRVPKNVKYEGAAFASRMYYSPIAASDAAAPYLEQPEFDADGKLITGADAQAVDMVKQMGENYLQMYRFVSVDGGATYSYIFRLSNIKVGKVGTYTDSSISISGTGGTRDLEDEAVIVGEVAKGQQVIHYMKDGKLYIEPTETISGKATNFKKDGTATINGEIYRADRTALGKELNVFFTSTGNTGKNNENTQYTVFGNYVLKIDATAVLGNASDYAVILYSSYDKEMGTAKARFAFADNTEGVYEISKCYGSEEESNSYMKEFQNNNLVGALCRVSIVNGMADLSAEEVNEPKTSTESGIVGVTDGSFRFDGSSYSKDSNSMVYLLYGGEEMEDETYSAIKAKAYKLSNLQDANAESVKKFNGTTYVDAVIGNAISNVGNGFSTLLVGVMTVGEKLEGFHSKTENIAYLLEATRNYNTATNKWYLDVAMISEAGLIATRTIDDVRSDTGANIYFNNGQIGTAPSQLKPGTIVAYKLITDEIDGEQVTLIESIGDNNGMGSKAKVYADPVISNGAIADGYYAVKVAAVEDEVIGFFPYTYAQDGNTESNEWIVSYTLEKDEHDFAVVAIDDNTFVEEGEIETITESDELKNGDYNAIIVVEGGAITRVFSLYNNF